MGSETQDAAGGPAAEIGAAASPKKRFVRRWVGRGFRVAAVLVVLLVPAVYFCGEAVGGRVIGWRLKAELAQRMHARLTVAGVRYSFPYTVRLEGAKLSMPVGQSLTAVDVGRLQLTLAKLPLGDGPLLVQSVEIDDPVVRMTAGDSAEQSPPASSQPAGAATTQPSKKLSDLFRLKQVTVKNGRFEYAPPGKPAVVWEGLGATVGTTPVGGGVYQFDLSVHDEPLAGITAAGSFDVDSLLLDVKKLTIDARSEPSRPAPQLPEQVREICRQFNLSGDLGLTLAAKVPLDQPQRGVYAATLTLRNGVCSLPDVSGPISPATFTLSSSNLPEATEKSLPAVMPAELPPQPPAAKVWINDLACRCGSQLVQLYSGEIAYDPDTTRVSVRRLRGLVDAGNGPGPLEHADLLVQLPFFAAGDGLLADDSVAVRIFISSGTARQTTKNLPVTNVNGMLTLTRHGISTTAITGVLSDGTVKISTNLLWDPAAIPAGQALTYAGAASIEKLDIHQLATMCTDDPAARQRASGLLRVKLNYKGFVPRGDGDVLDALAGQGNFDIQKGHFVDIPVLKDVLADVHEANGATVGEVAATFDVARKIVRLDQAAASSPAVGVQGGGTIGFDQRVNMTFVLTPLADWSRDMKSTGIKGLSDWGADLAGGAQRIFNGMQTHVYQERLTGTLSDIKHQEVVAPDLTDHMDDIFNFMSGHKNDDAVAEKLKAEKAKKNPAPGDEDW